MIGVAKIGKQALDELEIICRSTKPRQLRVPQNGFDHRRRR
jgi:hypothetical protein